MFHSNSVLNIFKKGKTFIFNKCLGNKLICDANTRKLHETLKKSNHIQKSFFFFKRLEQQKIHKEISVSI